MNLKVNYVRICIALLTFVVLSFNASAKKQSDNELTIIKSDMNELVISYKPNFIGFDTINAKFGVKVLKPIFSSPLHFNGNPGSPSEIFRNEVFNVFSPNSFELSDVKVLGQKEYDGIIYPISESNNDLKVDWAEYRMYERKQFAEVYFKGIGDKYNIAGLKLFPAVYNGYSDKIIIPQEIIVKIKFKNVTVTTNANDINYKIKNDIALNSNETVAWQIVKNNLDNKRSEKSDNKLLSQSSQNWVKITIPNTGIYKINASQLKVLGFNIANTEVNSIKIYGKSGKNIPEYVSSALNNNFSEQPIIVKTNNNGDLDAVEFFANGTKGFEAKSNKIVHYINNFSETNYYYLTWGGDNGKRAVESDPGTDPVTFSPQTYYHRLAFEEELHNPFGSGSGKQWFGRTLFPAVFTNQLYDLDRSGTIFYRYSIAQKSKDEGSVNVSESNNILHTFTISGYNGESYTEAYRRRTVDSIAASKIGSDNRSVLRFDYTNKYLSSSIAYFDYYEIHYPRSFSAINNELYFMPELKWSGNIKYNIDNFNGSALGWDITDLENPKLLKNLSSINNIFEFTAQKDSNEFQRYYISSVLLKPDNLEIIQFADLRHNFANTDIVVIAPSEFKESAQKYCDYRNSQKELTASYININDIYTEFGSGIKDHTAIRDFIAFIKQNWSNEPKYIVLWGDGHYDYRNLETKNPNWIPAYESIDDVDCFNDNYSFASDDFYSSVVGEDWVPDIVVSRVPVLNADNGNVMVDKIKSYENNSSKDSWRTNLLFVADDSFAGNGSGGNAVHDSGEHAGNSESVANYCIPDDMQIKKIYLTEYKTVFVNGNRRKPKVSEDFISTVNNSGAAFVNWVGHGNPRVWAHEEVFDRDLTIPQLKNLDKLFFLVAATCDFGRYDLGDFQAGSEDLVRYKNGGAIGTLAATRIVSSGENSEINKSFYQCQFKRDENGNYKRIGDVYKDMKTSSTSDNDLRYNLLCDPLIHLVVPSKVIQIDSINDICMSTCTDTLNVKALTTVKIKGRITNYNNPSVIDTSFNGSALVAMFDSDVIISAIDDFDGTIVNIKKNGPALNKSAYPVVKGEFSAEFVIPKDISYSNNSGRIYIYANSNNNTYAKGSSQMFRISGINKSNNPDKNGPDISIYLDSRSFKNKDIVCKNPLLLVDIKDESGVNSTGTGIGHRIEAWIDNSKESIDLTDYFTTSIDDSKSGTISKILYGLEKGIHKIKIRAWDVYNNFSVSEVEFEILNENDIEISMLSCFPNPIETFTDIVFTHNIADNYTAKLEIFSLNGDLIKSFKQELNTLHTGSFNWDLLDNNKNIVPSGSYICKLKLTTSKSTADKFTMMTVVR